MSNHFIAVHHEGQVVEWLDPKPVPYQPPDTQSVNFKSYLHGGT